MSAHRLSAAKGRLRRSVEQQELWHKFVDKLVEQKIGEEVAPAVRRDGPTGGLGAAALGCADDRPTWQLQRREITARVPCLLLYQSM